MLFPPGVGIFELGAIPVAPIAPVELRRVVRSIVVGGIGFEVVGRLSVVNNRFSLFFGDLLSSFSSPLAICWELESGLTFGSFIDWTRCSSFLSPDGDALFVFVFFIDGLLGDARFLFLGSFL